LRSPSREYLFERLRFGQLLQKILVGVRELFKPCVAAGLIPAGALAGYRNDAVYLPTSPD